MGQYELSEETVLLILLHAAKYPSCTICGVLLGDPGSGSSGKACAVKTAIPLFHLSMLMAPCVETALTQVQAYAQQQGLKPVGYYHCEARFTATEVHPVAQRIAERLADRHPATFIALLDNQKLAAFSREGSSECPLELLLRDASGGPKSSWKKVAAGSGGAGLALAPGSSWEGVRSRFLNLHAAGRQADLADFDEHLDDVTRDWLNPGLLSSETALLAK